MPRALEIAPPQRPREALRRFFVALVVVVPIALIGELLFDLLGLSERFGSVVGLSLGLVIAAQLLDRRHG